MNFLRKYLIAGLICLGLPAVALAAGYFPFPAVTVPLTGNETIPADTQLAGGVSPQTELITTTQLKDFIFGGVAKGTATASGATTASTATLNTGRGSITSASMTLAAAGTNVLTLTNSTITANSIVLVSVANGTNTTPDLSMEQVTPGAGTVAITTKNNNAGALNGTIIWNFVVIN